MRDAEENDADHCSGGGASGDLDRLPSPGALESPAGEHLRSIVRAPELATN